MDEFKPESAHDNFLRCFRAGDLEGLVALYESDATMVAADGTTHSGQAAIRAALPAGSSRWAAIWNSGRAVLRAMATLRCSERMAPARL